jgi:hypothetical protein
MADGDYVADVWSDGGSGENNENGKEGAVGA